MHVSLVNPGPLHWDAMGGLSLCATEVSPSGVLLGNSYVYGGSLWIDTHLDEAILHRQRSFTDTRSLMYGVAAVEVVPVQQRP